MATTKTLTPTNQNITLSAFTEKPDNRINVANDEKLADAVNALNSNINKLYTNTSARYIKHFMFQNVPSITIDLQHEQTNDYFSMIEVVNANQNIFANIEGTNRRNYGTANATINISGSTATITLESGGKFWGITHVTLITNYQLT